MSDEFLLHRAIIENNVEEIESLTKNPINLIEKDFSGFSALELIHYLDRPFVEEKYFKVMKKGSAEIVEMGKEAFESYFHIHYLPTLKFSSFAFMKKVINNCPYMLRKHPFVAPGHTADISIRWIDSTLGYGLFAESNLPAGTYVGEYTGLVRQLYRFNADPNGYCFHYPTKFWSWNYFMIDALLEGNELRFVNHSDDPSMDPACLVDRGLLHLVFFTNKKVLAGEQLTFDYGKDYWKKRHKL